MKGVVLHEFVQSRDVVSGVRDIARKSGFRHQTWTARSRYGGLVRSAIGAQDRFIALGDSRGMPTSRASAFSSIQLYDSLDEVDRELLLYMVDREGPPATTIHTTLRAIQAVTWATDVLDSARPELVAFADVPHNAWSYALYLIALHREIDIAICRRGPAPHVAAWSTRIDDDPYRPSSVAEGSYRLSPESRSYLDRVRSDYPSGKPPYMRAQEARRKPARLLRRALMAPRRLSPRHVSAYVRGQRHRANLRAEYESMALARVPSNHPPHISVFLHFQPERTTIPEGGAFALQYRMVAALSQAVPEGWQVWVREHPSTFLIGHRAAFRSVEDYYAYMALPGVRLLSSDIDPYAIIDSSRMVATVTGTVGLEAVARCVPVLVFGEAAYQACQGVWKVASAEDVATALHDAREEALSPSAAELFLVSVENAPRVVTSATTDQGWTDGSARLAVLEKYLETRNHRPRDAHASSSSE